MINLPVGVARSTPEAACLLAVPLRMTTRSTDLSQARTVMVWMTSRRRLKEAGIEYFI